MTNYLACEYCGEATIHVRLRRPLDSEPVTLCADCWLDVQNATQKERQVP